MEQRTGIYIRLSVDRDGKAESPDRHLKDCQDLAAAQGLQVVKVYEDRDKSAFNPKTVRAGFDQMVKDLEQGLLQNVIAWDFSRLTRRGPKSLMRFLEAVDQAGGRLQTVHQSIDTSTPMGAAVAGLFAAQAQMESEATSRRVSGYHAAVAAKGGLHSGGSRAYGYQRDGGVIPEEKATVLWMVAGVHEGRSFRSMAMELNDKGLITSTGKAWSSSGIGMLLRNPRLAGIRVHNGVRHQGTWKPILSVEEHHNLVEALSGGRVERASVSRAALQPLPLSRDGSTGRSLEEDAPLLVGLVICGLCSQRLIVANNTKRGLIRYMCHGGPGQKGCGKTAVKVSGVDGEVLRQLFSLLEGGSMGEPGPSEGLEEVVSLAAKRLKAWDLEYSSGNLDPETWKEGRVGLRTKLESAQSRLEASKAQERLLESGMEIDKADPRGWWENASQREQVATLRSWVNKVEIRPSKPTGGKFDTSRVRPQWTWALMRLIRVEDPE